MNRLLGRSIIANPGLYIVVLLLNRIFTCHLGQCIEVGKAWFTGGRGMAVSEMLSLSGVAVHAYMAGADFERGGCPKSLKTSE